MNIRLILRGLAACAALCVISGTARAQATHGSAAWSLNPGSGDWNTGSNWTPATAPNGPSDTATFGVSHTTGISISATTQVSGITFTAGASAYTITNNLSIAFPSLTISGTGITNNSGTTQNLVAGSNFGTIQFSNSATAGNMTVITNSATVSGFNGGTIRFSGNSTAGSAMINNNGTSARGATVLGTVFSDSATAGSATINNNATTVSGGSGNFTDFNDSTTAGSAIIKNNGATGSDNEQPFSAGKTYFDNTSSAGAATLIANGGTHDGFAGSIFFGDDSTGGTSRIELFGNGLLPNSGFLDISSHNAPGVAIGSIEGTGGVVFLGANNLTVGSNNLSTTFSGIIQDGASTGIFRIGGSLTKIGTGTLTLSGTKNTYSGPTAINAGVLNVTGSITSAVTVNRGGTLEGSGTTGDITVNGGGGVAPSGQHREIVPPISSLSHTGHAAAAVNPVALHINGDYVQNAGGTLVLGVAGATTGSYDQLIVTGNITLHSGAILDLDFLNGFAPKQGEVFNLLSSGISSITGDFSTVNLEGLAPGFEFDLGPSNNGTFDLTALNNGVPAQASDTSSTATLLLLGVGAILGLNLLRHRRSA